MKVLHFDCFSGAGGDMIVGALVDLGANRRAVRSALASLELPGLRIAFGRTSRHGIGATKFRVRTGKETRHRGLREIRRLLRRAEISGDVRKRAESVFRRICEVEAAIHGVSVEQVHLHEVGALDSIADVIAAMVCLEDLAPDRVVASELPLGGGTIRSAHGVLPVPAPATLALLAGVPVRSGPVDAELVTPTGAALLTAVADAWGPLPRMRPLRSGWGAGDRDHPDLPNLLRVIEGEADPVLEACPEADTVLVLEANLDDLNPQIYGHLRQRLVEAGALDVFYTAVQMKKDRPGTQVTVLCRDDAADRVREVMFLETTTIGVRWHRAERQELARESVLVTTPHGNVHMKVSTLGDEITQASPEYEDCRKLAGRTGLPLRQIQDAARRAFRQPAGGARKRTKRTKKS